MRSKCTQDTLASVAGKVEQKHTHTHTVSGSICLTKTKTRAAVGVAVARMCVSTNVPKHVCGV